MAAVTGSQLSPLHENIITKLAKRNANKNRLEHKKRVSVSVWEGADTHVVTATNRCDDRVNLTSQV